MNSDLGDIDLLVLCGGRGTRLSPILPNKPKILAEINGRPFIDYLLSYLETEGIKKVFLCTGYMHELIEEWVKSIYSGNLQIIFSHESKPLGTAGAIKNAESQIRGDHFFVINGDTYLKLKYSDFLQFHLLSESVATLAITEGSENRQSGNIEIDSENRIICFTEKPLGINKTSFLNTGVYCFSRFILDLIPESKNYSLEYDCFPKLISQVDKYFFGYPISDNFTDIGTPQDYFKAFQSLL